MSTRIESQPCAQEPHQNTTEFCTFKGKKHKISPFYSRYSHFWLCLGLAGVNIRNALPQEIPSQKCQLPRAASPADSLGNPGRSCLLEFPKGSQSATAPGCICVGEELFVPGTEPATAKNIPQSWPSHCCSTKAFLALKMPCSLPLNNSLALLPPL